MLAGSAVRSAGDGIVKLMEKDDKMMEQQNGKIGAAITKVSICRFAVQHSVCLSVWREIWPREGKKGGTAAATSAQGKTHTLVTYTQTHSEMRDFNSQISANMARGRGKGQQL